MDKGAWRATVDKVRHDVSNLASKIILTLGSITIFNCCCSSVAQSCPTLCNHMDCSKPGFILHHLPEFAQTHVHWLSQWCHTTVSSSIVPFSSYPQSFPSSGSLPVSQLFASGGQSIGVSASASVLPMNIQNWFPLGLTGWISLLSKELSRAFSSITVWRHQFFPALHLFYCPALTSYMSSGKTIALTIWTFVGKVMTLLLNRLSRFVIAFLPRSKCLLILWLPSPPTVILEPKKIKFVTVSIFSPSLCHEVMDPDALIFIFWMLSYKPVCSVSSFTFIRRLFTFSNIA